MSRSRIIENDEGTRVEVTHRGHAPQTHSRTGVTSSVDIYNISLYSNVSQFYNQIATADGLRMIIEAASSILRGESDAPEDWPVALRPNGALAREPAPTATLLQRTAHKVWLQQRLHEYGASWQPASTDDAPDAQLQLEYEDLKARIERYGDEVYCWHVDKGNADCSGVNVGLAEALIAATEVLIAELDARAEDANNRLGGPGLGDGGNDGA